MWPAWDAVDAFRAALSGRIECSSSAPMCGTMPLLYVTFTLLLVAAVLAHWHTAIGSTPVARRCLVLPGSLPLLGHCHIVLANVQRQWDWLYTASQQMGEGKTFALSMPLLPSSIVISDRACLQHVLKHKADNYIKGHRVLTYLGPVLGHGILAVDGANWYWQHKLAAQIFNVKSFKKYIDEVFSEKMHQPADVVGHAAANGSALDLHDLMYRFTLDSFGLLGFGVDPGCLCTPDQVPFAAALDRAQAIMIRRFWLPGWQLLKLLTGARRTLAADVDTLKSFALATIDKRRKQHAAEAGTAAQQGRDGCGQVQPEYSDAAVIRDQGFLKAAATGGSNGLAAGSSAAAAAGLEDGDQSGRDLLSLFMAAQGPDGKPLSTQQLIDTVLNFIIGGRDTTAQALSWTFYLLLQHPEVERKLLQEINQVFGTEAGTDSSPAAGGDDRSSSGLVYPSYDQLRRLHYAHAVFMEAVRLYTPLPSDVKYAVQRDVLPDGTVVPAGTQVFYSPYVVNRLQKVWGPDALDFRPERWLEMQTAPDPYSFLTFNAGPRLCLGKRLAELEGVFVLTSLLSRFSFRQSVPGTQVTYSISMTLPMKEGLMVMPEWRGKVTGSTCS